MNQGAIWAMFYSSILGMGMHPGTTRDGATKITPEEAALLADRAMAEYLKRYGSE